MEAQSPEGAAVTPQANVSVASMSLACIVTQVTGTLGGSCLARGRGADRGGGERESRFLSTEKTGKSPPRGAPWMVDLSATHFNIQ